MTETATRITVVPANEASWKDLQTVFGTRGQPSDAPSVLMRIGSLREFK